MSVKVVKNAGVILQSVNLSSYVTSASVNMTAAEVTTTAMGQGGVTRVGGLRDDSISVDFNTSYGTSSVESLLSDLVGVSTASIVVYTEGTVASTANPAYSAIVMIPEFSPLDASVGELSTSSVTCAVQGTVTKLVA
jgi:hypothetical protein